MNQLISVLQTVLPVFIALGLGMLCRSKKLLTRQAVDGLKKVVVDITLPAVLLSAFATTEYSLSAMALPVLVFVLCCVALALGFGITRLTGIKGRLAPFVSAGFEAGTLGYALFAVAFPRESISHFALLDLGQTLFVFTLFKLLISGKKNPGAIVKDMVSSPVLLATIAGLVLGATGLYGKLADWGVQGIFTAVTDFIAAPTGMAILLVVGYDLVPREIPWKKVAGLIALRLGVVGAVLALLLALNNWVLGGMIFPGAAIMLFLLPPPYAIPIFADEPAERVEISSALSAMTLVSMILFAVLCVAVSMG